MYKILPKLQNPDDLREMSVSELEALAVEIRSVICDIITTRSVHFASNLGVVELTLALYSVFNFSHDRLIWDVGHQSYAHKLITGRFPQFSSIRMRGGLMGYPNPAESPYDLFMTGHAGISISTALGLKCADDLCDSKHDRHAVAVIGDGALANGVVFEALNHLGELKKNVTIILNDNKMSICPRTGGLGRYLDSLRMDPSYTGLKEDVRRFLQVVPLVGSPLKRFMHYAKRTVKAGFLGGMLFEELGIRYVGPVDGHNIRQLQKVLRMARNHEGPTLLHLFTRKGNGYKPAEENPTAYHAPAPILNANFHSGAASLFSEEGKTGESKVHLSEKKILSCEERGVVSGEEHEVGNEIKEVGKEIETGREASGCSSVEPLIESYTQVISSAVLDLMGRRKDVVVITAAMCQGNMLQKVREIYPDRFYDVGICESHAVALAAGMARGGLHPLVDIYSTFMQRAYDQLFHELSLQNLPVTLLMDRSGLVGADGPTHHGVYDLAYMRHFPNFTVSAPADAWEAREMLELAVNHPSPWAVRYPKAYACKFHMPRTPVKTGHAEVFFSSGSDGRFRNAEKSIFSDFCKETAEKIAAAFIVSGAQTGTCLDVASRWEREHPGKKVAVINARFIKPLDTEVILEVLKSVSHVVTVEEGVLQGGMSSAILEAACDAGVSAVHVKRLGIPDYFIQHASREEQMAEVHLDAQGIYDALPK